MYVLRDVLQYATDLESGVNIIETSKRTWAIYVALSSKTDGELEILTYAADNVYIYSRDNQTNCQLP